MTHSAIGMDENMKDQGLGTKGLGTSHPSEHKSLAGDPGRDQGLAHGDYLRA